MKGINRQGGKYDHILPISIGLAAGKFVLRGKRPIDPNPTYVGYRQYALLPSFVLRT
jgi:hypothetical protein